MISDTEQEKQKKSQNQTSSSLIQEKPHSSSPSTLKKFELSTQFSELDLPKFVGISSVVYIGENVLYYPFDVIRTRLQTVRGGENFSFGSSYALGKQLGWRGLYRGFWTSSLGALPPHAIYFLSYNYWKDKLQRIHDARTYSHHHHVYIQKDSNTQVQVQVQGKQAIWVSFVAGGLADFFANFFMVPYEVVVQRIQIQDQSASSINVNSMNSKNKSSSSGSKSGKVKNNSGISNEYKGGIDAVRCIYRQEGIRGFFRGFGASLLAYAPASAIWWASYEQAKADFSEYLSTSTSTSTSTFFNSNKTTITSDDQNSYSHSNHNKVDTELVIHQHVAAQILAGAVAGWITTITTNPMDVIKTRLQTQHYQLNLDKNKNLTLYSNGWSAFRTMLKEEGWRSFTRGIGPKLFTTTIFSSWFGIAYEFILNESKKKQ